MGVALMTLFLAECTVTGERCFFKNQTEAKRWKRDRKGATIREFKVELTKAGVLEALNRTPFRKRAPAAPSRDLAQPPEPDLCVTPVAPPPLDPAVKARIARLYRIDREDRHVLKGKHPEYVRGWNRVKNRRVY